MYKTGSEGELLQFLESLKSLIWGTGLIVLLLAAGVYCLFRCGREMQSALRHSERIPLTACLTSLGAAMGTGNIAGVASAIALGGAGAVFWMWAAGICGAGLLFAENVLSAQYRRGTCSGAPAYLRHGMGSPLLAGSFSVCCIAASFGMGCMTQTHTMARTLEAACGVPAAVTGLLAAGVTAAVILGGAKRIGTFLTAAVPVVSVVYLLMGLIVIVRNGGQIGAALAAIFRGAFGLDAAVGGIAGETVRRAVSAGVRRGVFSNEAGLGSSGLLHGEANGSPGFLGLCAVGELIADTFVCCTVTALVLLTSGASGSDADTLLLTAFRTGLGRGADLLLPPVTALFALCTLIGWSFCGAQALRGLTSGRFLTAYRIAFCIAAAAGACFDAAVVWTLADIANGLMAYCNLPGVVLLAGTEKMPAALAKQTDLCYNKHSVQVPPARKSQ